MTPTERLHALQRLAADLDHLHLSLDKIRELDAYLRDEWGIRLFRSFAEQNAAIAREVDPKIVARYQSLQARYHECSKAGRRIPAVLEIEIYDVRAQHPFFGLANSNVRTIKLDTLATLTALIQKLDIRGPILDVGCNVGNMTRLLTRQTTNQFLDEDFSPRSIENARSRASGAGNVRFDRFGYLRKPFGQKYDLIFCSAGFEFEDSADVV